MKHHSGWLAAGLLIFVVLACSLGKKTANNSNTNSNSNTNREVDLGSGVAIKEIHMAKDDGNGAPGDETDTFDPGDRTIHCVTVLKEPKAGTRMRFAWWIVDAEGKQNQKVKEIDYTTKAADQMVHGHLALPQDWPSGKYKVQVYVNGDLDKTAFFSVR